LSGLSRITGPISGDVDTAAAGSFDPDEWFGALSGAKLFGVLALTDILNLFGFDELDKLPQFVGQSLNQVEQLVANIERLRTLLTTNPVPETAAITALLDQLLDPDTGSIPALMEGGSVATVVTQLSALDSALDSLQGTLAGSALPPGPKSIVSQAIKTLQDGIDAVLAAAGLLQSFADGEMLPESLEARFEWRPEIKPWGPFKPSGTRNLVLAVQAAGDNFTVTCSLDDFILDLYFVILDFERVQLRMRAGEKPEVDVKFTGFEFAGPLSFVETLRDLIPFDGFSDPPDVEVTAEGSAGFTMGCPTWPWACSAWKISAWGGFLSALHRAANERLVQLLRARESGTPDREHVRWRLLLWDHGQCGRVVHPGRSDRVRRSHLDRFRGGIRQRICHGGVVLQDRGLQCYPGRLFPPARRGSSTGNYIGEHRALFRDALRVCQR
jgi:hypothetical protein